MAHAAMHPQEMPHWRALLDSAGEGIWGIDLHGNCTFVNRIALSTFGFAMDEVIGSNIHSLIHHHYPDGRSFPAEECPIYEVLRKNEAYRSRLDTLFRKDGSSFTAEVSAQPVTVGDKVSGVVVTFRDITEHRLQQDELRRAYELAEKRTAELDAVIESIPHGVYVATLGGDSVRLNRRAFAMSGPEFPAELRTLERALAGESSTETLEADGRWLRSVAAPITLNGELIGGVAVNTDVTQLRLQDEALRKSEKLAAVGQLASSIAHEINNPLESITNLLYLIRNSSSMEEIQEYAGLAQTELTRVTEITLQTLRFHRQNSRATEVKLEDLAKAVVALYTGRMLLRKVRLEWKLAQVPPVVCLEGEIRQVLNNLIRNALDALGADGSLSIRVHEQTDFATGRKGVRLTIADNGEGIHPYIEERLFEPFQTTKETTGTGLGLWVSKGIVEKHGGYLRARTRREAIGHGTVFALWLPLEGELNLMSQAAD
ncbi:MAG: hypothetical protein NVSMB3_02560 [Acidobacteriaceae bacterium]